MGSVINTANLKKDLLERTVAPIILCSFPNRVAKLMESGQYIPLNLNVKLAEALLIIPQPERSQRVNEEIMKIINQCREPVFLKDYEILFDPRYDIDPIKVFIEISRRQKVIVKWCGRLNGNMLEYATPEHQDYRSFRIQNYGITCAI